MVIEAGLMNRYVRKGGLHEYTQFLRSGQSYRQNVLDPIAHSLIRSAPNPILLDVASGVGEAADYLSLKYGLRTMRCDISTDALSMAHGEKIRSFAEVLPIADGSLDGIHMKDALVHIEDKYGLLREFSRVLKPGGKLVLVSQRNDSPGPFFFYKDQKGLEHLILIESSKEYALLVRNLMCAGFTSISLPYYPCRELSITRTAQQNGFTLCVSEEWTPQKGEKDWFKERVPRFVLTFEK